MYELQGYMARSARPRDVQREFIINSELSLRGPGVEHLLQPIGLLITPSSSEVGSEGGSEGGSEELRIA